MLLLTFLLFTNIGLLLVSPLMLRNFIDQAILGQAVEILLESAALFLLFSVCNFIIDLAISYIAEDISWRVTNNLRADIMSHCLQLDLEFYNQHTPGELIERIDGDTSVLTNFFRFL